MAENSKIEWTDHIDRNASGRVLGAYKTAARRTGCSVSEWIDRRSRGQKWCFGCRRWKPAAAFTKDSSRTGGLTSQCKPCMSSASTASRYGVTRAEIVGLKVASQGQCGICRRSKRIVVDHNHTTGMIRGMLCDRCNQGLGFFADSAALLRSAAEYLEAAHG